jgi:hypothetical protein
MLTQIDKERMLSEFPNLKLSYENITYKKVNNFDYVVAIPQGKKCFAWFTFIDDKMVCLIMELTNNKQIIDIKISNACFSNELSYGTVLYGTFLYVSNNKFFFIEDIFTYKGETLERKNWGEKLFKINNMLKKDLKQVSYNNSFIVFGLPLMCKTNEELQIQITNISYPIETIQFKLFNKVNSLLFMFYKNYIENKPVNIENKPIIQDQPREKINVKQYVKREIVFSIKPDIQDDIYYLYCLNNESKEEQHSVAHIQDFNASVMMNKLFRIIKENNNLDALEESDDEEEFENKNIDKFVHLDKSYKMLCQFNHKFKKWVPIKLAEENTKIITSEELAFIYKSYEQNRKKYY